MTAYDAAMTAAPIPTADDPRWPRIRARDAMADGRFYYSVQTTGVYCRPSCASRLANPANVTIHDTIEQARATGFRPCRRCDPEGEQAEARAVLVARACRAIEAAEAAPALADLAATAQLSPGYFQRMFKAATGLSPRGYFAAKRAERLRKCLPGADSVTAALHDAGFGSSSRFYAAAGGMLGMAPGRYRRGGAVETLRFAVGQSSLGAILVASSDKGVAAVLLGDDPQRLVDDLQRRFPAAALIGGDAGYEALAARAIGLVEQPGAGLDLPLDIRGTVFQQRVWDALRAIPAGETRTYADIAEAIGSPRSVRAVAAACAANAHALAIPCHRVIRSDGGLSGYCWGVERKAALLAREAAG